MNAATVLRRAAELLVEPAPVTHRVGATPLELIVTALSAGAGATTVSRGLAIALQRLRPVELTGPETSGAVAAGPGTAVVRDVVPGEVGSLRQVGPGRLLVAVADGRREPQLAALVLDVLAKRCERVMLIANRVRESEEWREQAAFCVPESRLGAVLVRRGRRAPGPMGASLDAIAAHLHATPQPS